MLKQGRVSLGIILLSGLLSGCLGSLWTGANLIYDRHHVYKKLSDYRLMMDINKALYVDKLFKNPLCVLDIAVFNGDILIVGHLPTESLLILAAHRLQKVKGYRRLFNQIQVKKTTANSMQDTWITTKIRSQIFADDTIDPNAFKILTADRVVYILGEVKPDQADKVIQIARFTQGVEQVVSFLKYFTYQ